jgi:dimethylglycine dehydrogenase
MYAVNSLRMEKGYGAWGHEYTTDVRMNEAGLGRFVHFKKDTFLGREALFEQKDATSSRQIVYFEVAATDADCLGSEAVYHGDKVVGMTTSGAFCHTTGKSLAFAYVDTGCLDGRTLEVGLLGHRARMKLLTSALHDTQNIRLKA